MDLRNRHGCREYENFLLINHTVWLLRQLALSLVISCFAINFKHIAALGKAMTYGLIKSGCGHRFISMSMCVGKEEGSSCEGTPLLCAWGRKV